MANRNGDDGPRSARIKEVFGDALDREDAERDSFVAAVCSGDPELESRVLALLAAHRRAQGFLKSQVAMPPVEGEGGGVATDSLVVVAPPPEGPPEAARYVAIEQIGSGGFGEVWLADQLEPVARRVALKVMRPGRSSPSLLARFELERRALGRMEHPHVATVYDAGTTRDGRPFFAMEWVPGESITTYCDGRGLGLRQRVLVFLQACRAVQHAHLKGVIHRDLKPSNVMVAEVDGEAVAKVIDFGIAKAIDDGEASTPALTEERQIVGTPEYMAPEQVVARQDVDVRADVYALGVILYELLSGLPPFDRDRLRRATFAEFERIVALEEPPRPSSRIAPADPAIHGVARARGMEVARLRSELRGDLDWIVLKALEKDRSRRYQSAEEMARDLEAYLADRVVGAGPPTLRYRMAKLLRRHRVATAIGIALVIGAAGLSVGGWLALEHRATVAAAQAAREKARSELASERSQRLERIVTLQRSLLDDLDAAATGDEIVLRLREAVRRTWLEHGAADAAASAEVRRFDAALTHVNPTDVALLVIGRQWIAPARRRIEREFADDPLQRAALQLELGRVAGANALPEEADALIESAIAGFAAASGERHRDTLDARLERASLRRQASRLDEAESEARDVLAIVREQDPVDRGLELGAIHELGVILEARGDLVAAEELLREAWSGRRALYGPDDVAARTMMTNYAMLLSRLDRMAEAVELLRDAIECYERDGASDEPRALTAKQNLAVALQFQGRHAEAEPLLREVYAGERRRGGEDHPSTLSALGNLGAALLEQNQLEEAEELLVRAAEGKRRVLGEDHADTLLAYNNLAGLYRALDRYEDAEGALRVALAGLRRVAGENGIATVATQSNLAWILVAMGRAEEAEPLARDAYDRARRSFGIGSSLAGSAGAKLGRALVHLERFAEAESIYRESLEALEAALGADHETTLDVRRAFIRCYEIWDEKDPGQGHAQKAEALRPEG
jgi:hypothetical protein